MRLVTYNIHHGLDNSGRPSLDRIRQFLQQTFPDVVFIQEIDRLRVESRLSRQAELLARSLKMNYAYGIVHRYPVGSYGNAILTRYPIISVHNHLLPDAEDDRRCLQVNIRVRHEVMGLFNTHLGLQFATRIKHLEEIILPLLAAQKNPSILGGDFNSTPDSPEYKIVSCLLQDSAACHPQEAFYTYPNVNPSERIDYIFVSSGNHPQDCSVGDCDASDHLPFIAKITVDGE